MLSFVNALIRLAIVFANFFFFYFILMLSSFFFFLKFFMIFFPLCSSWYSSQKVWFKTILLTSDFLVGGFFPLTSLICVPYLSIYPLKSGVRDSNSNFNFFLKKNWLLFLRTQVYVIILVSSYLLWWRYNIFFNYFVYLLFNT